MVSQCGNPKPKESQCNNATIIGANFNTSKRSTVTFKAGKYKVPICILSFFVFVFQLLDGMETAQKW